MCGCRPGRENLCHLLILTKGYNLLPFVLKIVDVLDAQGIFPPDFAVRNAISFQEIRIPALHMHPCTGDKNGDLKPDTSGNGHIM